MGAVPKLMVLVLEKELVHSPGAVASLFGWQSPAWMLWSEASQMRVTLPALSKQAESALQLSLAMAPARALAQALAPKLMTWQAQVAQVAQVEQAAQGSEAQVLAQIVDAPLDASCHQAQ